MHQAEQSMLCLQSGTPAKHMTSARAGMVPKENVNANTGNAPRSTGALRPRPHAGDAAMAELTEQVTLYTADFCTPCISSGGCIHPCCSLPRMVVRVDFLHISRHAALHESQQKLYTASNIVQNRKLTVSMAEPVQEMSSSCVIADVLPAVQAGKLKH